MSNTRVSLQITGEPPYLHFCALGEAAGPEHLPELKARLEYLFERLSANKEAWLRREPWAESVNTFDAGTSTRGGFRFTSTMQDGVMKKPALDVEDGSCVGFGLEPKA